jgi:hypothetical protein
VKRPAIDVTTIDWEQIEQIVCAFMRGEGAEGIERVVAKQLNEEFDQLLATLSDPAMKRAAAFGMRYGSTPGQVTALMAQALRYSGEPALERPLVGRDAVAASAPAEREELTDVAVDEEPGR